MLASALQAGALPPPVAGEIRWQLARALIKCDDFTAACEQITQAIPNLGHDPLNAGRAMIQLCQAGGGSLAVSVTRHRP